MATEASEDGYLVRVRAQVMSRDDSSGGWVPLGGGGLSNVCVRKRPRATAATTAAVVVATATTGGASTQDGSQQQQKPKHDYLIYGKRISDQSVVLSCTIKKDFEYNKVMPTFHHWRTGEKRFGLTFMTAADARAFDRGVRTAVEELLEGLTDTYPSSPVNKYDKEVGDDDVFMTLDLPQDSRSSSDSSVKVGTTIEQQQQQQQSLATRTHYIREKPLEPRPPTYESVRGDRGDNYSYVQLGGAPPGHDYIYPVMEEQKGGGGGGGALSRHETTLISPAKQPVALIQPQKAAPPPTGKFAAAKPPPTHPQSRCKYCHHLFTAASNRRGACVYAPDCFRTALETVACMKCLQCVSYHCAADAEGDFAQHPCECDGAEERGSCARRWACIALLSLFVPCLWLYPPLRLCHWCAVRCGACGGRHAI